MRFIILVSLFASSFAALRGYVLPNGQHSGGHSSGVSGGGHSSGGFGGAVGGGHSSGEAAGAVGGGHFNAASHNQGAHGGSSRFDEQVNLGGASAGGFGEGNQGAEFGGFDGGSQAGGFEGGLSTGFGSQGPASCSGNQISDINGNCVEPEISRNLYAYNAPQRPSAPRSSPVEAPTPKLNYNIVFVRTSEGQDAEEPIVIPPPQQKTIVYVLQKDSEDGGQQVIEVPAGPEHKPEVYYVNYEEGENPQLPIGIDLRTALASAATEEGKELEGASEGFIGSIDIDDGKIEIEVGSVDIRAGGAGGGLGGVGEAVFVSGGFSGGDHGQNGGFGGHGGNGSPLPSPQPQPQPQQPSNLYNAPQ